MPLNATPSEDLHGSAVSDVVTRAPCILWRADASGQRTFFNPAWLKLTAVPVSSAAGSGWIAAVHPDDAVACQRFFAQAHAATSTFVAHYRLRAADGTCRRVEDRAAPVLNGRGECVGWAGMCVDVEDRVQMDEARASFLSFSMHEMRTPLQALKTYVELMERALRQGDAPPEGVLPRLGALVDRLADLTTDIADLARLELGKELMVRATQVDVGAVVASVVDEVRLRVQLVGGQQTIVVTLPAGQHGVRGDAKRLARLLRSVLDHALTHAGPLAHVTLELTSNDTSISIRISGNGPGIAPQHLASVREIYRSDKAGTASWPRPGLGLALAAATAYAHGGSLALGNPQEGLVVTVALPTRS
jgi:PAS domain S-box-containing protein